MSFAASIQEDVDKYFEWSSDNIFETLNDLRFWKLIGDMVRFNYEVERRVVGGYGLDIKLSVFLEEGRYGDIFKMAYLLPMVAAVWSSSIAGTLEFPVGHLFRFFYNHGMARVFGRPQWKTVKGRSKFYVEKIVEEIKGFGGKVRCGCKVVGVERVEGICRVKVQGGESFDCRNVVFATSAPVALKILGDAASDDEKSILRACRCSNNEVVIHTDEMLMPKNRKTWAAWNFIGRQGSTGGGGKASRLSEKEAKDDKSPVCVTYWTNLLQNLDPIAPNIFETLNPVVPIDESKVLARTSYSHPQFTMETIQAQQDLGSMQGVNRIFFAGAWTRYGFHEDGAISGMSIANIIAGCELRPWKLADSFSFLDNSKGYQLPYFEGPGLLFLNSAVGKVYDSLNEIIAKDEYNAGYGAHICGHLGRLEKVGKRTNSAITVRSWKFYARIMDALCSETHYVSDAVVDSFESGELDVLSLDDLRSFVLTLVSGQLAISFPKEGSNKIVSNVEKLPDSFSIAEKILLGIVRVGERVARFNIAQVQDYSDLRKNPTGAHILRNTYGPCWWNTGVVREKGVKILELFGALELTTVASLTRDKTSSAIIVADTEEDFLFASSKAISVEGINDQVTVFRYKDFVAQDRSKFDYIVSPLAGNTGAHRWKTLESLMKFVKLRLNPGGTVEFGFTSCADRSRVRLLRFEKGTAYTFVTTRSIADAASFVGLHLHGMKRMNENDASLRIKSITHDLQEASFPVEDTRRYAALLTRWETALEVGRISRVVTLLKNTQE